MIVTDQKISETTPKMLSRDTLTGCGSLGSNRVCNVNSGLVPMSPKTTPRAPSASAPCAAARRFTLKVSAPWSPRSTRTAGSNVLSQPPWPPPTLAHRRNTTANGTLEGPGGRVVLRVAVGAVQGGPDLGLEVAQGASAVNRPGQDPGPAAEEAQPV